MTQQDMFGKAMWLGAAAYPETEVDKGGASHFPILRSEIVLPTKEKIIKAELRVVGLGYFHCYLNGERVSDDEYMPLCSDFEQRENYPPEEKLTGHRIYVPEYDVTDMLEEGKNIIAIHFGGGWYTHGYRPAEVYGDAKAIYSLTVETRDGTLKFYSSTQNTKVLPVSFVKKYHFAKYEHQDYTDFDGSIFGKDYDDTGLEYAVEVRPLSAETVYDMTDCPVDKVIKCLTPRKSAANGETVCYDVGENTTGYPVFKINAAKGEKITVVFSEDINEDGTINDKFTQKQEFTVVSEGKERIVRPMFVWYGFRCFSVSGAAQPISVNVVYADVKPNSSFECDNDTLNWLYKAFMNTQACNMHGGIPSDCPHIERRGYTGDGQLVCHTAMMTFDAKAFYRKWLSDISDCQDVISGHVQYTAPYVRCGGGPGGWGSAIVEVPYRYYLHYGEKWVLSRFYPQMLRYFDYLESHSENDLIISDKAGEWCLGDWATPASVVLPAPYVNNYFYIKSLEKVIEIARLIGKEEDIPKFEETVKARKHAIMNAYFNKWDGNFLGNLQGANAFAVDIGLGDERTYPNMVEYYRKKKCYDTGIFGTELVTRLLFERGDGDVAVELLTSQKEEHTFDAMRQRGATTLWEYFPGSLCDRSHSHPMFGAVVAYLFEYLLGIKCVVGGKNAVIEPFLKHKLGRARGNIQTSKGEISMSYEKSADLSRAEVRIMIPDGIDARFRYGGEETVLVAGENLFDIEI